MNWLIAYAALATVVLVWALFELKVERDMSRMSAQFRENDRKFYRGWENIWFTQIKQIAKANPTTKSAKKRITK